jgi:predicted DNA-binding transcriptional regulator AlpA
MEITGLKKTMIYKLHQKGELLRTVKLSTRAVGWIDDDIHRWIADRRSPRA